MHSLYSTKKTSKAVSDVGNYFHIPIIHLVYPQMSCVSFVSNFTRDLQSSQENLKTILMQKFGGKTMCIMVNVKVVNVFFSLSIMFKIAHAPGWTPQMENRQA